MIEFTSESPKPNPSGFVVSMAAVIRLKLLSSSGGPLSTMRTYASFPSEKTSR